MDFAHLRCSTHASLKHGLMDAETLVQKAKEQGHSAVALTDADTLSLAVEFYSTAKKEGVKPIVGLDALIETDLTNPENQEPTRLLLLAKNANGYRQLMELVTRSNMENYSPKTEKAYIKQSWLKELQSKDLIALTGNPETGEIPRLATTSGKSLQELSEDVKGVLKVYREMFGENLFLEVSRYGDPKEDVWVERMAQLSQATKIPLVATHGVLFANREDFYAHEVHAGITNKQAVTDPNYKPSSTREQYYRSTEDMMELFSDLPQAVANAGLIAQKCTTMIDLGVNHLPNYPLPEGENLNDTFVRLSKEGLQARLEHLFPDPVERKEKEPEYMARLEREMKVILDMQFPGYFLVVSDFIRWSKEQDIPVGPGRGSGAGSLVAYSLSITDIDPIQHNLLFERFLNPERVSMPDIDIDFCRDRRDETIGYIFERYGAEAVSQISTFNTLAAKAAIRHVGKVMNYPLPLVDEVARMVPEIVGVTLDDAIENEEKLSNLYANDKRVRRLLDMAKKLEGASLTTGVHAGGVIIAPGHIADYAPMMRASGKNVMVTQYTKDDAEKAGLIKFDLLGLKTLTAIQQAKKLIDRRPEFKDKPLDLSAISLNDPDALNLLREAKTYAVFQLESKGMRRLVQELRPDNFEDIVALLALFRPGPMKSGMVDSFVARKHGREEITYYHPKLEELLKPTYGVIVYQEQVMQIAQAIAGYSLGGADLLRRAMGKKKPEEMAKERIKFESGAEANGVDKALAKELFDAMEKFAEYGFNRSHSAAYAVLSIQTAYLKAKYPAEFFAAYMNVEIGAQEVLAQAVTDARSMGIQFNLPDINESSDVFEVRSDNTIQYSLAALKGASSSTIQDLVACRNEKGKFESLRDYLHKMNDYLREHGRNAQLKQTTEAMIKAGAFDSLNPHRAQLMAELSLQLKYLGEYNRRMASQSDEKGDVFLPALWKAVGITPVPAPKRLKPNQKPLVEPETPAPESVPHWSDLENLQNEAKSLGFYLSNHPYQAHVEVLDGLKATTPLSSLSELELGKYETVLVAGVVEEMRIHTPPNGKKMAFLVISDGVHRQDVTVFNDGLMSAGKKIKEGALLGFEANVRTSDRKGREGTKDVAVRQVFDKKDLMCMLAENVQVACTKEELPLLQQLQEKHKGDRIGTTVFLPDGPDRYFKATLPEVRWSDDPNLFEDLAAAFPNRVKVQFVDKINFAKPFQNSKPQNGKNNSFSSDKFSSNKNAPKPNGFKKSNEPFRKNFRT